MQAFQRDLEEFESLDAQVLGVSQDSVKTHEKFARENGFSFPLIDDEDGSIAKLYPGGRVTYIIDKEGIVRFAQKGLPDNDLLLRELTKLPR
ncbi:MAG: redoxin domain-containing protein [Candidatus Deferrimicrobiaceae bacterium]